MKIFVPKEINRERRVAASPDTVKKFISLGHSVVDANHDVKEESVTKT